MVQLQYTFFYVAMKHYILYGKIKECKEKLTTGQHMGRRIIHFMKF